MRSWSIGKVLVLVTAANLLLGSALLFLRPPSGSADAAAGPPPALPTEVHELQAKLAQGRSGEPYTLDLSNEELTATAGYFLARGRNIPFTRVRIAVTGGKVVADGVTKNLAVTVPIRVTAAMDARGGLPQVAVEDVSLGETPVPGFARDQILREANASLDFSRYNLPVTVDTIELREGGLTIQGAVK